MSNESYCCCFLWDIFNKSNFHICLNGLSLNPTNCTSGSMEIPNLSLTPENIFLANSIISEALAPPRFMSDKECFGEMTALPNLNPFGSPDDSMSLAAETLTFPSACGQNHLPFLSPMASLALSKISFETTGFLKKEPALLYDSKSGCITIPF